MNPAAEAEGVNAPGGLKKLENLIILNPTRF
jgi:hypothetical protein